MQIAWIFRLFSNKLYANNDRATFGKQINKLLFQYQNSVELELMLSQLL